MKLYQVIDGFIHSASHSSLLSVWEQTETVPYQELTDFFKKEYLNQDLILEVKERLFKVSKGYLEFDEIVLAKSKKGVTDFVKRRHKSAGGYIVPGVSIIVLIWTDGKIRIPLRFRIQRNGEKSTGSVLGLLSWYRNKICRRINYIAFDSGFASEKIFKRLNDYGWTFVTRLPKSRKFNGKAIYKAHRGGYWNKIGEIKGGIKVKAVRRKDKFYITNRLSLKADKIEKMYRSRAIIEEVFRVLKQECHWSRCQLRDHQHYENYYMVGIINFMVLEYLRIQGFGKTIYRIRRDILLGHVKVSTARIKRILLPL